MLSFKKFFKNYTDKSTVGHRKRNVDFVFAGETSLVKNQVNGVATWAGVTTPLKS